MKKRLTAIVLTAVLAAVFIPGCKKNVGTPEDNPVEENSEEDVQAEEYTFVYSCRDLSDPFCDVLKESIRTSLEEEGHHLLVKDGKSEPDRQAEQLLELSADEVDGVFLCPSDEETLTPSLEALDKAGIPVIDLRIRLEDSGLADAFIGSDEANAGKVCGEDLTERRSSGGKIVIVESLGSPLINERITGFEEAVRNQGFEVVKRIDASETSIGIQSEIERILNGEGQIDAVMCGNDQMASEVLAALEKAGDTGTLVYSVGGSPEVKKALSDPESPMAGTGALSPINMGKTAARTAVAIADGGIYETEMSIETFLINRDNLEMYGTDGWQ